MTWYDVVGVLFGGGGIAAFITAWSQRNKTRAEAQGEVASHYETLVSRLESRITALEKRVELLEGRNTLLTEATSCAYKCTSAGDCPVLVHLSGKEGGG